MLFSFCFTFNLLIIKKKKKKCAEDSVAVLGHHSAETSNFADINARKLPYLPVYNAHFFSLKSTFKFTMRIIHGFHCLVKMMRIIHGFHCLVKKTKEDKNFAVIGV